MLNHQGEFLVTGLQRQLYLLNDWGLQNISSFNQHTIMTKIPLHQVLHMPECLTLNCLTEMHRENQKKPIKSNYPWIFAMFSDLK